jgi:PAS domain S-box-containing protein
MASIMVVDDDHLITEELELQLGEMGYNIVGSASSGHEAVRQARKLMPDLILMDIVMPEMDGIDAARTIREEMDIPSIFLTGYRDIEYLNRALELEPYGYLFKPPQRDEVYAAIETALARIHSDKNLRESYKNCLAILENTSEMLLVIQDGKIKTAGPSITNLLGYESREVLERPIADLLHLNDRAKLNRLLEDMPVSSITADPILVRMSHSHGGTRWTSLAVTPITWKGDRALLCAATDVTKYVTREHDLLMYRRIIDEERCGVVITDVDQIILYANKALLDMHGFTDREILDAKVSKLCMEGELKRERDFVRKILSNGGHPAVEMQHRKKDGSPLSVLISGILLSDDSNNPEYMARTVIDISRLKETEKRLTGLIETLEQRNEDIQSFAAIVSHDLRIPLIRIKHMNRRFREHLDTIDDAFKDVSSAISEKTRERLVRVIQQDMPESIDFIENSVIRLERMTASIKRLSRYSQRPIELEPVNTKKIVESCLNHWKPLIESGNVLVHVDNLPEVVADLESLELVFSNLIDNAIKYLDHQRPGLVHIFSTTKDDRIMFHIADNGCGINPEDIDRIFQIFQRGRNIDAPGDGMGLAFVRILLERHGGEIVCTSNPGEGSVFTFTIPVITLEGVIH